MMIKALRKQRAFFRDCGSKMPLCMTILPADKGTQPDRDRCDLYTKSPADHCSLRDCTFIGTVTLFGQDYLR